MMKIKVIPWVLCMFTVIVALLTLYQIKQLADGHASAAQAKADLNQAQLYYSELLVLASDAETLTERNWELNLAMPTMVNEDLLIKDLSTFIFTLGGDLRGLQIDLAKMQDQNGIMAVPVNLEITTDYIGLLKVMDYLQHGPRATQVNSFTIHRIDDLTTHELLISAKVTIFFLDS